MRSRAYRKAMIPCVLCQRDQWALYHFGLTDEFFKAHDYRKSA